MKQKSNLARCYVVSLSKIDAVEEYVSSLIQNKQENEFVDLCKINAESLRTPISWASRRVEGSFLLLDYYF